jgi:hypothetical protein
MTKPLFQIGNVYEIDLEGDITVVTAVAFDESDRRWIFTTERGKTLRVSETNRFIDCIKPRKETTIQ